MATLQRNNLAQELHDGIAQDLVGLGYSLDLLLANPDLPTQSRIDIRTLRFSLTELLEKVRSEIHELRKFSSASLAQQIQESAESICGDLECDFQISEVEVDSDSDAGYQILQIARELFRNSAAHSRGSKITVKLASSPQYLELEIADNGKGGALESKSRYGIVGLHSRAENIGANLAIHSSDTGTRVLLRVPQENMTRP